VRARGRRYRQSREKQSPFHFFQSPNRRNRGIVSGSHAAALSRAFFSDRTLIALRGIDNASRRNLSVAYLIYYTPCLGVVQRLFYNPQIGPRVTSLFSPQHPPERDPPRRSGTAASVPRETERESAIAEWRRDKEQRDLSDCLPFSACASSRLNVFEQTREIALIPYVYYIFLRQHRCDI